MYKDSGIYIYRNKINGKKYVGQAMNLHTRYLNFKNTNHIYGGKVINNARKKYGVDVFEYSILTHCPINELNYWERFYIKRLNTTVPNGYNMTDGGDTVYTNTDEYKAEMEDNLKEFILKKNPNLDVSMVKYDGHLSNVTIICPKHGPFKRTPNSLQAKSGNHFLCPDCFRESVEKRTESRFFKFAREKYGDKYSYEKTVVKSWNDVITITCKKHGDFRMRAGAHVLYKNKGECQKCTKERLHNEMMSEGREKTLQIIKEKFGDSYSLEKFKYKGDKYKVTLTCPKHGDFSMTVNNLKKSCGCPSCTKENYRAIRELRRKDKGTPIFLSKTPTEIFIEDAKKVHGDKYDYSETVYTTAQGNVKIKCPKHGVFVQKAYNHLNGYGCKECGFEEAKRKNSIPVLQMDLDGNVIAEWNSFSDIKIDGKDVKISHIVSCCTGKRNVAFGCKWKYKEVENEQRIVQKQKDGSVVKIWGSLKEIHKEKPIKSTQHILRCLEGKSITAGGYKWEYYDPM